VKSLQSAETHVGRLNGDPVPQIVLNGMGIKSNHAVITNEEELGIFICPITPECGEFIFVNGTQIFEKIKLNHNDRLIFGTTTTFLV